MMVFFVSALVTIFPFYFSERGKKKERTSFSYVNRYYHRIVPIITIVTSAMIADYDNQILGEHWTLNIAHCFCKLFIRIKQFNEQRNGGKLLQKQQKTNRSPPTSKRKGMKWNECVRFQWVERIGRKEQFRFLLLSLKEQHINFTHI